MGYIQLLHMWALLADWKLEGARVSGKAFRQIAFDTFCHNSEHIMTGLR